MEKLDEEEKKSRTSSVSSTNAPGNPEEGGASQDSGEKANNAGSVTKEESMEVAGSEEGRQPITSTARDSGQTMEDQ